jgi:hypothetical protein
MKVSLFIEGQRYKKHMCQDRERIVACANRGEDWVALAVTLDVKYKTAFHWVHSGVQDVTLCYTKEALNCDDHLR